MQHDNQEEKMEEHQQEQPSEHQDSPSEEQTAPATTAEADGKPEAEDDKPAPEFELVEITWRGITWHIPKDRGQWDMNVQFEMEDGRKLRGLLTLLGGCPENIQVVREQVYAVARTAAEVDELTNYCVAILNKECVG